VLVLRRPSTIERFLTADSTEVIPTAMSHNKHICCVAALTWINRLAKQPPLVFKSGQQASKQASIEAAYWRGTGFSLGGAVGRVRPVITVDALLSISHSAIYKSRSYRSFETLLINFPPLKR
jgi:hypothetical protein